MVLHLVEVNPLNKQMLLQSWRKAKSNNLNIITYTGYTYEEILATIPSKMGWKELCGKLIY